MHQPIIRRHDLVNERVQNAVCLAAPRARAASEYVLLFLAVSMLWGLVLYVAMSGL